MRRYFCSCISLHFSEKERVIITSDKKNIYKEEVKEEELTPIEWSDCKHFVPPILGGRVIKVYDSDTITIASRLPYNDSPLYRFSIRLHGIDAPEIKGKTPEEKAAAQVSKQALETLLLNKNVTLRNLATEKYGRVLANVYLDETHVNQWLLDNKYAVPYDGGKK
jgi:hypothetical protein